MTEPKLCEECNEVMKRVFVRKGFFIIQKGWVCPIAIAHSHIKALKHYNKKLFDELISDAKAEIEALNNKVKEQESLIRGFERSISSLETDINNMRIEKDKPCQWHDLGENWYLAGCGKGRELHLFSCPKFCPDCAHPVQILKKRQK